MACWVEGNFGVSDLARLCVLDRLYADIAEPMQCAIPQREWSAWPWVINARSTGFHGSIKKSPAGQ